MLFVKKLLLTTCALVAFPTAAYAQSTGTIATEEENTITVTGTRVRQVDGVTVPDTTKAKAQVNQEFISRQVPGNTLLNSLNLVPGVNFTNSDPYGSSGGNIRIRGFDGNRISVTFDGVPLNDSGNYAIFSNQQLDPELVEQINVGLGVTDVDSPTASAAGGTINYRTIVPSRKMGVRLVGSVGDFNYRRLFAEFDTGEFGPWGTRAFISASRAINDKFKGPGQIKKKQFNARIYQDLGNNGDFISLAGHYNENRNNFYRNPSLTDLRGIYSAVNGTVLPAAPTSTNPFTLLVPSGAVEDALLGRGPNAFENLASCNRTIPGPGQQNDNGGTGPNGTGANAPAIDGSTANNPLNSASCSNFYGVRINPSNTGNIRGSSRFTLGQGLLLTVDPSYQYVLANGGGSTTIAETNPRVRGATTLGGVDYNGDGNFGGTATQPDTIRFFTPNNTNTHRLGLTSSLLWEVNRDQRIRVAYTYDRARHRQTGEWGFLDANGFPLSPFGGREAGQVVDASGFKFQQRDRLSYAILHQISGQYIGRFFDRKLRVEVGIRRPFFIRNIQTFCPIQATDGFAYCTSQNILARGSALVAQPAGTPSRSIPIYVNQGDVIPTGGNSGSYNFVYAPFKARYKYGKILPNTGFTYNFTPAISVFGSYAKGFSSPRTDNLYRAPVVNVQPESTNAFDLGARYTNSRIQAQVSAWKIDYKNRIVTSFDQEQGISIDRNVGKVKSYGFDASIAGKATRWLSLIGMASYTNAKLKQDVLIGTVAAGTALPSGLFYCNGVAPTVASGPVTTCAPTAGKFVTETPKWQVGSRAEVNFGWVSAGIQAKRVGSRFATDVNDVRTPAYTLVDADVRLSAAPLGFKKTYLQLNVTNLTDKFYYGNISTQIRQGDNPNFSIGGPRTFLATLNVGL